MKSFLNYKNETKKQRRQRRRRRATSLITAAVVLATTCMMTLPSAISAEEGDPYAEPDAQVVYEPLEAEPVPEPIPEPMVEYVEEQPAPEPEPIAAEPVEDTAIAEPVEAAEIPAADETAAYANEETQDAADPAAQEAEKADSEEKNEDEEPSEEESKPAVSPLVFSDTAYTVKVFFGAEANLSEGTSLSVRELAADSADYGIYRQILEQKLTEDGEAEEDLAALITSLHYYELTFYDANGALTRPAAPVSVTIEYAEPFEAAQNETFSAVTFCTDDGQPTKATLIEKNKKDNIPAVDVENGLIKSLYVEDFAAQDIHTNPVIGRLALTRDTAEAEVIEDVDAAEEEFEEEIELVPAPEYQVTRTVPVEGAGYNVIVEYGSESGIPEDAAITAVPVLEEDYAYDEYKDAALDAVEIETENAVPALMGMFDLTFYDEEGNVVEPLVPIRVSVDLSAEVDENAEVYAVHFADPAANADSVSVQEETDSVLVPAYAVSAQAAPEDAVIEVIPANTENGTAVFEAESFSVYAIVYAQTITTYITTGGDTYEISVTCSEDARIPEGSSLAVSELTEDDAAYADYLLQSEQALGVEEGTALGARMFDITILDPVGEKIEPEAPVQVEIRLVKEEETEEEETEAVVNVVHFGETTEVLSNETTEDDGVQVVTFETESFSIYTVVDLPASTDLTGDTLGLDGKSYAIVFPYGNGNNANTAAMAEQINNAGTGNQDRLKGQEVPSLVGNTYSSADAEITKWTFEYAGSANLYYVYAIVNGQKKYIQIDTGAGDQPVHLVDEANKAKLYVEKNGDTYQISDENKQKSLNNLGGWPANGIGATGYNAWNSNWLRLCSYDPNSQSIAGQKFAIIDDTDHNGHAALCGWDSGHAQIEGKDAIRLASRNAPVREDANRGVRTFTKGGGNTFISEWTFTPVYGEADTYYLQRDEGEYLWADYNNNYDRGVGLKVDANNKTKWKVVKQGNGSYSIYVAPGQGQNQYIYLDLAASNVNEGYSLWNGDHGYWLCKNDNTSDLDLDGAEFAIVSTNNQTALVVNGGNVGSDQRRLIDIDNKTVAYDDDHGITTWKFTKNGDGYVLSPSTNGNAKYLKFNGNDAAMTLVDNANDASTINVIQLANGCVAIGGVKVGDDTLYLSQWHTQEINSQNHDLRVDPDIFNVNDKDSCNSFLLCTPVKTDVEDEYIFNTYGSAYKNQQAVATTADDSNGPRTGASLEGNYGTDALEGQFFFLWDVNDDPTQKVKYLYNGDARQWTLESLGNDEYVVSTVIGDYRNFLLLGQNSAHLTDAKSYYANPDNYKVKIVYDNSINRYTISRNIGGTEYYLTLDKIKAGNNQLDYEFRSATKINGDNARMQQFVFAEKGRKKEQEKTATKVSVQSLEDGKKVIPYYVVTDPITKKEKYYAIDKNGKPFEVTNTGSKIAYSEGDPIEWTFSTDGQTDKVHYQFINDDGGRLLPTSSTESPLITTDPFGAVLPGREDGKYTSKIVNYDQSEGQDVWYAVGYDPDKKEFVSVPMDSPLAVEMRFASVDTDSSTVNEVATVDSEAKNITMKMYDYPHIRGEWNRTTVLQDVFGTGWEDGPAHPGILEKKLGDDGYPVTNPGITITNGSAGKTVTGEDSIATLFGEDYYKGKANHLFLQSEYDATGYYHYRSWENYAYYNNGNFKVYDAVGTPSDGDHHAAYSHGNFMPYNDLYDQNHNLISPSEKNYFMFDNEGLQLPANDPRLANNLYLIPDEHSYDQSPDYFFGMTMEVPFSQPKNGLVDGTKNMTFEFNGDDDMWVYVDGVLLLDIGGIHDPRAGWIDFTTGDIYQQDGLGASGKTTIRQRFKDAGVFPDGKPWDDSKVDQYFKGNTFKDYSNHTLNMYYFERGAGASNLDIRFNLITRSENEFEVTKTLSNKENADINYQEPYGDQTFKFNAYVHRGDAGKDDLTKYTKLDSRVNGYNPSDYKPTDGQDVQPEGDPDTPEVFTAWIKDSNPKQKVTFNEDGTFNLKAGQSVVFHVEDKNTDAAPWYYYIEEVGVDADYDLKINDVAAKQVGNTNTWRCDPIDMDDTATAEAENTPKQLAELKLTKEIDRNIYNAQGQVIGKYPEEVLPTEYFEFKIELENPDYDPTQEGSQQYKPYRVGDYYVVKDGHYYTHNGRTMTDVGTTKTSANKSSANGYIYNIPAGYTVIVEGLLPGTDFRVTEITRDDEQHYKETYYTWENYYLDKGTDHEVKRDKDTPATVSDGITGTITTVIPVTDPVTFKNNHVTTTNMPKVRDITLKKVDDKGNALEGAEFSLYYVTVSGSGDSITYNDVLWKNEIKPVIVAPSTDAQVVLENLPHGRVYKLEETKAPDGYVIKTKEFYFKVEYDTDGNEAVILCDQKGAKKDYGEAITLDESGDKITLTVENPPGAELPMTGGRGTTMIYLLGALFAGLAGVLLWRRRRLY